MAEQKEKRGRGKPCGPRPDGWDKRTVAQWMIDHPAGSIKGDLIPELCDEFPECNPQALYQEIQRWRRRDEEFDQLCRAQSGRPGVRSRLLELQAGMEDWKVRWAEEYLHSRSRVKACEVVGVSINTVNCKLAKNGSDYDPELDGLREQVEAILLAHKEADLEWAFEEARMQGDARTVGNLALGVLERLDKAKWSRSEEVRHSGTVHHEVTVRQQGVALSEAAEVSRGLPFAERLRELAEHVEPDYVEAEVVVEEVVGA